MVPPDLCLYCCTINFYVTEITAGPSAISKSQKFFWWWSYFSQHCCALSAAHVLCCYRDSLDNKFIFSRCKRNIFLWFKTQLTSRHQFYMLRDLNGLLVLRKQVTNKVNFLLICGPDNMVTGCLEVLWKMRRGGRESRSISTFGPSSVFLAVNTCRLKKWSRSAHNWPEGFKALASSPCRYLKTARGPRSSKRRKERLHAKSNTCWLLIHKGRETQQHINPHSASKDPKQWPVIGKFSYSIWYRKLFFNMNVRLTYIFTVLIRCSFVNLSNTHQNVLKCKSLLFTCRFLPALWGHLHKYIPANMVCGILLTTHMSHKTMFDH